MIFKGFIIVLFMLMCFQVCRDMHRNLYFLKSGIFQEKECYISTIILILKIFLAPINFFIPKIISRKRFYKIFYHSSKTLDATCLFLSFFFLTCHLASFEAKYLKPKLLPEHSFPFFINYSYPLP